MLKTNTTLGKLYILGIYVNSFSEMIKFLIKVPTFKYF